MQRESSSGNYACLWHAFWSFLKLHPPITPFRTEWWKKRSCVSATPTPPPLSKISRSAYGPFPLPHWTTLGHRPWSCVARSVGHTKFGPTEAWTCWHDYRKDVRDVRQVTGAHRWGQGLWLLCTLSDIMIAYRRYRNLKRGLWMNEINSRTKYMNVWAAVLT